MNRTYKQHLTVCVDVPNIYAHPSVNQGYLVFGFLVAFYHTCYCIVGWVLINNPTCAKYLW